MSSSSTLLQFLSQVRSTLIPPLRSPHPLGTATAALSVSPFPITLVLGNPSCDLDSFISATLYAFFRSISDRFGGNKELPSSYHGGLHVPILNLPSIPSHDLWRLRSEFGTALRLAVHGCGKAEQSVQKLDGPEDSVEERLLENLVTVSDIRCSPWSPLYDVFVKPSAAIADSLERKKSVVLVDHNALTFSDPTLSLDYVCSKLELVGCIDHHVDEGAVPSTTSPRIVQTGVGSCTTLVVKYSRDHGLWNLLIPASTTVDLEDDGNNTVTSTETVVTELATLSLAAILIDTANLTAEGKVSAADVEMVEFLENIIITGLNNRSNRSLESLAEQWNRQSFYNELSSTKENSLSLLSLPEIFSRDYKTWSETATSHSSSSSPSKDSKPESLRLGISSIGKPISWLTRHKTNTFSSSPGPSSSEALVKASLDYATQEGLDLFVLMTSFSVPANERKEGGAKSPDGKTDDNVAVSGDRFERELCIFPISNKGDKGEVDHDDRAATAANAIRIFERLAEQELGLQPWADSDILINFSTYSELGAARENRAATPRVWTQTNVAKSRKQVAPLLRKAMTMALE